MSFFCFFLVQGPCLEVHDTWVWGLVFGVWGLGYLEPQASYHRGALKQKGT